MEREEMKRIQKEMEKRLGDDWDIQPVTVNKVGGQREGLSCRYQEENMAVMVYPSIVAGRIISACSPVYPAIVSEPLLLIS